MGASASASSRRSVMPAVVVFLCLPLPVVTAVLLFASALRSVSESSAVALGFAASFGYLVTFLPALVVFEPAAIIASIAQTRRYVGGDDEPIESVIACWAAVALHTAAILFFLRRGWR